MGLLRLGIIAAVGVALLPSDSEQQEMLYNRAALAAQWTVTYCERNAQTCTLASGMWDQFVKKAQFGARLAYDTIAEQISGDGAEPVAQAANRSAAPSRGLETGTLKASDLEPGWRGARTPSRSSVRLDGTRRTN